MRGDGEKGDGEKGRKNEKERKTDRKLEVRRGKEG